MLILRRVLPQRRFPPNEDVSGFTLSFQYARTWKVYNGRQSICWADLRPAKRMNDPIRPICLSRVTMLTLVVLCSTLAITWGISQRENRAVHSPCLPAPSLAVEAESLSSIGSDQQSPDSTLDCSDAVDSILETESQPVASLSSTSPKRVTKSTTLNDYSRATQERGPPSTVF